MSTAYHAKYFAHELTRRRPLSGVDRLSMSLFDAAVDLNPHQIDAALFALHSPLSKGTVLADEVGLGKTIEAALVLCQYWAERRRRLLVICPASLRKQWAIELEEKFNLRVFILDSTSFKDAQRNGNPEPFSSDRIVICSMNFASRMKDQVKAQGWDLVVIDEAHKLRNAYRPSNKMGQQLRWALEDRRKLLLTATPLQNTLLELYGLSTLIDDQLFGDVASFRSQYMNQDGDLSALRKRLREFCKRTLRSDVAEYIKYTQRRAMTRQFRPADEEQRFYAAISAFLVREDTYSIPKRQRMLTTLILRKLLASSTRAIQGTLQTLRDRLVLLKEGKTNQQDLVERIIAGEGLEDEYLDEIEEAEGEEPEAIKEEPIDLKKLAAEIQELDRFILWASTFAVDTKTRSLLNALEIGFGEMSKMDAPRKAIIFTESRRTQDYLISFLEANGYSGALVKFSGSNSDAESSRIYQQWVEKNRGTGRVSGSRVIDIRTALIDHFRDHATIMVATEAAAEGVNLQFCSLVVNYDLPWNPQRVEQRIGRCHRYGQKHDVVVVNLLNERNEADRRVLELLTEKFKLFDGVFGSSDEILGTIESGVDFERRILEIYQQCRTPEEIDVAFRKLQSEMDEKIQTRLESTRKALLEHFDEDVHARLRMQLDAAREQLDSVGRMFWETTKFILDQRARFEDKALSFDLVSPPKPEFAPGTYHLISKKQPNVPGEFLYRLSHPLGEYSLDTAKLCSTPTVKIDFDLSHHGAMISSLEPYADKGGWLVLQRLTIESFEKEEYLLFSGVDDAGKSMDQELCEKLFRCAGRVRSETSPAKDISVRLAQEAERHVQATISKSFESNNTFFQRERDKLEQWADDVVLAADKALSDTKAQIKALNRQARVAPTLEEQHAIQAKIRELEKVQRKQRQGIFDLEDEVKEKRDQLIQALERRMRQRTSTDQLFAIHWSVV
jgi:hypothetical protein